MHKLNRPVPSCKLPHVMQRHIGPAPDIFGISGLPITMVPCLHRCKCILKGSYGCGEPKNAVSLSVQLPHRLVPSCKLPRVMQRHVGPVMEIFRIWGLPIAIIPCLHQSNVYIKRKLRVWRIQNLNFLLVQRPHRPVPCCKLPHVMQHHVGPAKEIFGISGLPIAMVPCLHQCNVYLKRKLRVWRTQKCNFLVCAKTALTGTDQQTTSYHAAPYWASNGNYRNFGATYHHGTLFAPMQCLY